MFCQFLRQSVCNCTLQSTKEKTDISRIGLDVQIFFSKDVLDRSAYLWRSLSSLTRWANVAAVDVKAILAVMVAQRADFAIDTNVAKSMLGQLNLFKGWTGSTVLVQVWNNIILKYIRVFVHKHTQIQYIQHSYDIRPDVYNMKWSSFRPVCICYNNKLFVNIGTGWRVWEVSLMNWSYINCRMNEWTHIYMYTRMHIRP